MIFYAGLNPNTGALLGIDKDEGYPFDARDIRSVKLWREKEELQKFLDRFPANYEIKTVTITVE